MTAAAQGDGHVHLQLGVYVLGALPADEEFTVAQHLVGCSECTSAAADLAEVRGLLDRLDERGVSRLLEGAAAAALAPTPPAAGSVPPVPAQSAPALSDSPQSDPTLPDPTQPDPTRPDSTLTDTTRPDTARRDAARPGAGRPGSTAPSGVRPGGSRRRWSRHPRVLVAALVFTLAVGISVGTWLNNRGPADIQLAGSQTDTRSGVSITVTVTSLPGGSRVRAEIEGLTVGESYRLYAVDNQGKSQLAAAWTAQDQANAVGGDVTTPIGAITEVTLFHSSDPVVTVRLTQA